MRHARQRDVHRLGPQARLAFGGRELLCSGLERASISREARFADRPTPFLSSGESLPMLFLISVSSADLPR
jgi:hypothetical protein